MLKNISTKNDSVTYLHIDFVILYAGYLDKKTKMRKNSNNINF